MTTKDLKLTVYHYTDENKRMVIINKGQMIVYIAEKSRSASELIHSIEAELTEDLKWKPQGNTRYTPMEKKTLDFVLAKFQSNPAYRHACEQGEIDRIQEKIDQRLQEIADMEKEIARIQGK